MDCGTSPQDLARSNDTLERRNDEIQHFYQHLSHELMTPLTVTRDYVSMVLEGLAGETTEEQRQFLTVSMDGCDQLTGHVHDLLDLTRADTGKLSLEPVVQSVTTLMESAVFALQPVANRAKIRLLCKLDETLPDVLIDEGRVTQVINNLVKNSIKFTPEGGAIELEATLAEGRSDFVEVSVTDTGRGIPEEDLEHVFERLFQCSNQEAEARKGLGLGLHLCREIVTLHGGEISVESTVGAGTTFRFLLPVNAGNPPRIDHLARERATL